MVQVKIVNVETHEHIGHNFFAKVPNKGEYIVLTHDGRVNYSTIRDNTIAYKVVGVILHGENSIVLIDVSETIKVGDIL